MRKRHEQSLSSDDRAALSSSLFAVVAFFGAVLVICAGLSFAVGRSPPDGHVRTTGSIDESGASSAPSAKVTTALATDSSINMPLP